MSAPIGVVGSGGERRARRQTESQQIDGVDRRKLSTGRQPVQVAVEVAEAVGVPVQEDEGRPFLLLLL